MLILTQQNLRRFLSKKEIKMTKKIAQYVVGKTAYKTRWAAETVATLINDGYIHDFGYTYARINHENLDDGFRIVYTDRKSVV